MSTSVFMVLSTVFYSINSPDTFPLSHSVLPVLFLPYWLPVCVACNTIFAIKHILISRADFVEVGKKYFEETSLHSLFPNENPQ